MSLSDLASLGSFVSGLAVLVSLIYLSLQVRQASKHQRALMRQGIASRVLDIGMRLSEPHMARVMAKQFAGHGEFSAEEASQITTLLRGMMASIEDAHHQYGEGLLDESTFQSDVRSVRFALSIPSFRAMWMMIRDDYSEDFKAYIDEQVKARPLMKPVDAGAQLNAAIKQLALQAA